MEDTEVTDVQVLDISDTLAPVDVHEECTRGHLMDPPDWRYQAAITYVNDLKHGEVATTPTDPVVQYLIRAVNGTHFDNSSRYQGKVPQIQRFMLQCWPALMEAIYYGTMARRSAVAAMIDTCIIKGWTYDEARIAGCPVSKAVYYLYNKAFFDLSGVRTVTSWIQDYLIEPERYSRNTTLLRARLLAYYGSGSAGVNIAMTGSLDKDEKELLQTISNNERHKQIFDYMVKHMNIAPDIYVGLMEAAVKNMSDHDFQKRMHDQEMVGSSSLEELADKLEWGIRAYSNQEIQDYDTNGLDFVNQFTKILTRTNEDGKTDITTN